MGNEKWAVGRIDAMKTKLIKQEGKEYAYALYYCLKLSFSASKFYTIARIGCEITVPLLTIFSSFLGKYLIDLFTEEWNVLNQYRTFLFLAGCILCINIFQGIGNKLKQYMQSMHDNILNNKLAIMLMDNSINIDLEYFDNTEYYDKLQAAVRDSSSIIHILWNAITFISAIISFAGIFFLLCIENPLYAILLTVTAIPYVIVSTGYTKSLYYLSMEQMNAERKKSYFQGITLDKRYAQDIRLFHIGDLLKEKYYHMWSEIFKKQKKIVCSRTLIVLLFNCIPEIATISIGIHIGFEIFSGQSTVGDYSLYMGLVAQFLAAFFALVFSFTNIYDNKLRIMNLISIFKVKKNILDNGILDLKDVDNIEFEHVSFMYPNTDSWVLKDVNFSLKKNEPTAFVGINASGKTTLIKLMLRMYDLKEGKIKINGIDIKEYSLKSLHDNFSVYFQEMCNYSFSLLENITIGDIARSDKEKGALEAIHESCCEDILKKSSKGLSTSLTRMFCVDGIELSGGQHQKLALARTLYRKSSVLVLDEPSSNLDPKAEHDIFENLKVITANKLIIFTSHRLSNVSLARRIIVLEEGKIIGDGTQEQLLKNNKRYAELFKYQSEGFRLNE